MGLQLLTEPLPYEHSRIDLDPTYRDAYGVPAARVTRRIGENERRMGRFIHARAVEILRAAGASRSGGPATCRPSPP
jgi:choline dehydrogenase-like flavoprotein